MLVNNPFLRCCLATAGRRWKVMLYFAQDLKDMEKTLEKDMEGL